MIFGPLFMILFLAVLIAIVVLLVRWLGGPWPGMSAAPIRRRAARRSTSSRSGLPAARSTRTSSRSGDAFSASRLGAPVPQALAQVDERRTPVQVLLILNDPPYGTERCYNGLRLALALAKSDPRSP